MSIALSVEMNMKQQHTSVWTVSLPRSTRGNLLSDLAHGTELRRILELGAMVSLKCLMMTNVAFLSHSYGAYGP